MGLWALRQQRHAQGPPPRPRTRSAPGADKEVGRPPSASARVTRSLARAAPRTQAASFRRGYGCRRWSTAATRW
ncbi:hypothetical protein MNEG_6840, partial [Monoraphidium neglectum]